jgi:hypothetical protein
MDRGMRVGAWLIALSVLATILLNCLGRAPHRVGIVAKPAEQQSTAAPECGQPNVVAGSSAQSACKSR